VSICNAITSAHCNYFDAYCKYRACAKMSRRAKSIAIFINIMSPDVQTSGMTRDRDAHHNHLENTHWQISFFTILSVPLSSSLHPPSDSYQMAPSLVTIQGDTTQIWASSSRQIDETAISAACRTETCISSSSPDQSFQMLNPHMFDTK